jgi:hypothetical protein
MPALGSPSRPSSTIEDLIRRRFLSQGLARRNHNGIGDDQRAMDRWILNRQIAPPLIKAAHIGHRRHEKRAKMLEGFSVPLTLQGKPARAPLKMMPQGNGHDLWEMLLENIP